MSIQRSTKFAEEENAARWEKKVTTPEQEAQHRLTDEALAKLPRKVRIELLRAELKRRGVKLPTKS